MASAASNHIKYLVATGVINFLTNAFKIILMESGFVFDPDTHANYADVSAGELTAGFGYLQLSKALSTPPVITEDDLNNRATVEWNAVTWTAAGGSIGPTCGAIIIDDTIANDPVVGFLDFLADYTQADGGTMTISDIEVRLT